MTFALIDGDCIAYRCAAVNETGNEGLANWQANQLILRIVKDINAGQWKIFLSGDNNFRYSIYPEYKANRRGLPRPRFLETVRSYLVRYHNADISNGYEADDSIGIYLPRYNNDDYVVCSNDKDFLQLEGRYFNFVRREDTRISRLGALRNFYGQLLVGDSADNIRGCPGIGKVKANKLLEGCDTEECFVTRCWGAFENAGVSEFEFLRDAKLLHILRSEEDVWTPPIDSPDLWST